MPISGRILPPVLRAQFRRNKPGRHGTCIATAWPEAQALRNAICCSVLLYADKLTPTSLTATDTGWRMWNQSTEAMALSASLFACLHDCVDIWSPGGRSTCLTLLHSKSGEQNMCVNERLWHRSANWCTRKSPNVTQPTELCTCRGSGSNVRLSTWMDGKQGMGWRER